MIDVNKLKTVIQSYKSESDFLDTEINKWRVVKWFQDEWDIGSANFGEMFKRSTSKASYLLTSSYAYPQKMILLFASVDADRTRNMFRILFDEGRDLAERVLFFQNEAKSFLELIDEAEHKGKHHQNINAISTYLWLRYPDKYYIYKYSECLAVAKELNSDFIPRGDGSVNNMIGGYRLYEEVRSVLQKDDELRRLIDSKKDSRSYEDRNMITATIDLGFYISKVIYDANWFPSGYDPGFSVEDWVGLLQDRSIFTRPSLQIMKRMKHIGGKATCVELADIYGENANFYNAGSSALARRIATKTGCPLLEKDTENAKYWPVLYKGREADKTEKGTFVWKLRTELSAALDSIDLSGIPLYAASENIDYIRILDYLKNNQEIAYMDPSSEDDPARQLVYSQMKESGESIVGELDKFAVLCSQQYGLDYCAPINWLNGSKTKTCRYFIVKLKKNKFKDSPIGLNLYVEYDAEHEAYYRVSLDIDNEVFDHDLMKQFHSYLDYLVMEDDFHIISGRREGIPIRVSGSPQEMNERIRSEGYRKKYQLCRFVFKNEDDTSESIGKRLMDAVESLKPYYDKVMQDEEDNILGGAEMIYDKNLILYGPPGTGKTYSTAIYAVAICDGKDVDELKKADYAQIMKRYDELKADGRIAFTTFHQSYGYEEFIEGIKPRISDDETESSLEYTVEPGVFKAFCDMADSPSRKEYGDYGFNSSPTVWKISLAGTYDNPVRTECMQNDHIRIGWDEYGPELADDMDYANGGKGILNAYINKMRIGDIVLSCYTASIIDAIGVVTGEYEWNDSYPKYKRVRKVKWLVKDIREDIVDLNGGTKMVLSTVYRLKISVGDVVKLLNKVQGIEGDSSELQNKENYVFIIDEINRGSISKIFGELITLIEDTKRKGGPEELSAILPYSGEPFSVPNNVYILGTMNTADRSISLMDTALRRRFRFVENMPDVKVLRALGADYVEDLDVAEMLEAINKRIEFLYDREHTIGHAFFTELKDDPSILRLSNIFMKSVIPLLQEYFYEDYEKIRLVLGDNAKPDETTQFIRKIVKDVSQVFKGHPEIDIDANYVINEEAFMNIESYKLII